MRCCHVIKQHGKKPAIVVARSAASWESSHLHTHAVRQFHCVAIIRGYFMAKGVSFRVPYICIQELQRYRYPCGNSWMEEFWNKKTNTLVVLVGVSEAGGFGWCFGYEIL